MKAKVTLGPTPFDVVDIPGRGKGVIANRDIKSQNDAITDRTDPRTLIRTTVSSLSQSDQSAFFTLSYAKPNTSAADVPFEIFQTNAISAGSAGTGLFPRTARLNHGCSRAFSAVYHWREGEGVLVVHAIRDIAKGQVGVANCGNSLGKPSSFWWALGNIDDVHGHEAPSEGPTESAASDRRLGTMVDLRSMFAMWGKGDIKGAEAIKLARRIWSTGETEGYISERGQLAADAAHVAAGHQE
ncbi:hypothetical protein FRC07_014875 [Ceratobasidium sp. 392]|nr:hypothetical protein FRC07_014875 [Ceratobasidium sp. 392]